MTNRIRNRIRLDRPPAEFVKRGHHYYVIALVGDGIRVSGPFVSSLQPSVHSQFFGVTWDE